MVHVAMYSISLYLINVINISDIVCFSGLLKRDFRGIRLIKGARGGVVVKALRYKPVGCGFDSTFLS